MNQLEMNFKKEDDLIEIEDCTLEVCFSPYVSEATINELIQAFCNSYFIEVENFILIYIISIN